MRLLLPPLFERSDVSNRHALASYPRAWVAPPPLPPGDADQVEGCVLRVDREGLLVDWGGRQGDGAPRLVEGRRSARPVAAAYCWWLSAPVTDDPAEVVRRSGCGKLLR